MKRCDVRRQLTDMASATATRRATVFGAYGHTGRFVVGELCRRGWTAVLSGRDPERLKAAAQEHPLTEVRVAAVDDPASLEAALAGLEADPRNAVDRSAKPRAPVRLLERSVRSPRRSSLKPQSALSLVRSGRPGLSRPARPSTHGTFSVHSGLRVFRWRSPSRAERKKVVTIFVRRTDRIPERRAGIYSAKWDGSAGA